MGGLAAMLVSAERLPLSEPEAAAKHVGKSADLKFTDFWKRVGPFKEKEGRGFLWDPCRIVGCYRETVCREVDDG